MLSGALLIGIFCRVRRTKGCFCLRRRPLLCR